MGAYLCGGLVLLPLLAAAPAGLAGRRRDLVSGLAAGAELLLAAALLAAGGSGTLPLPGLCGFGLALEWGGLRSLLALLAAVGWLAATLVSREYFSGSPEHLSRYTVFWLLTLSSVQGVFLSADLLTTFVFFELMSFLSYVLVVHTQKSHALRAGDTYLAVAVIGGLATLGGLAVLHHLLGTLSIDGLYAAVQAHGMTPALWAGGLLTAAGFLAKAGAFPLHIWLPTAHPAAPAPASGVLSGVIVKGGVFGLLAVSVQLFRFQTPWGVLLLSLGLLRMFVGAALALTAVDIKRILACSSVSQVGFILVGAAMECLLGGADGMAAAGIVLHMVNHSAIKIILFPAAGVLYCAAHTLDLDRLRGIGRNKPWLAVIMLLPMLSLAGVPGTPGYVSKTLLHEAVVTWLHTGPSPALQAVEWLFLLGGGLTWAYLLKLFAALFLEPPREGPPPARTRYMFPLTGLTLSCCAAALIPLGLLPQRVLLPLGALGGAFLSEGSLHPIPLYSAANLRGAMISMVIGVLLYLYVVRRLFLREDAGGTVYRDLWPRRLDLEGRVYRPLLLKALPFLGAVAARAAETLVDGALKIANRLLYHRQTSTVEPDVDPDFAAFSSQPRPRRGFRYSFAYSLMLMGLGIAFVMLYLILA